MQPVRPRAPSARLPIRLANAAAGSTAACANHPLQDGSKPDSADSPGTFKAQVSPPHGSGGGAIAARVPIGDDGGDDAANFGDGAAIRAAGGASRGSKWTFCTTRIAPLAQLDALRRRLNAFISIGSSSIVTEVCSTGIRRDRSPSKCVQRGEIVIYRHRSATNRTPRTPRASKNARIRVDS